MIDITIDREDTPTLGLVGEKGVPGPVGFPGNKVLLIADKFLNEILGSKQNWVAGDQSTLDPPLDTFYTHLSTYDYDWGFPSLKGKGADLVKQKLDAAGVKCKLVCKKKPVHHQYDTATFKTVAVVVVDLNELTQIRGEVLGNDIGIV